MRGFLSVDKRSRVGWAVFTAETQRALRKRGESKSIFTAVARRAPRKSKDKTAPVKGMTFCLPCGSEGSESAGEWGKCDAMTS